MLNFTSTPYFGLYVAALLKKKTSPTGSKFSTNVYNYLPNRLNYPTFAAENKLLYLNNRSKSNRV